MKIQINCIATGSDGNSIIVTIGDKAILLDAGVSLDAIRRGNDYKINNILAALITHSHKDHSSAVPELLKNCIPVYAHENIGPGVIPYEYKNSVNYFKEIFKEFYDLNENITIAYVDQMHDTHCVGYDIITDGCLIHYVTDTRNINFFEFLTPMEKKLKIKLMSEFWICECNYTSERMDFVDNTESAQVIQRNLRTRDTHLSDETVCNFFTRDNAKAIIFTHQSSLNFDEAEFRRKFRTDIPFEIAKAGKIYEFDTEGEPALAVLNDTKL